MHVAFGRQRIYSTDDADYGIGDQDCLKQIGGNYRIIRIERVGNRSSLLQKSGRRSAFKFENFIP